LVVCLYFCLGNDGESGLCEGNASARYCRALLVKPASGLARPRPTVRFQRIERVAINGETACSDAAYFVPWLRRSSNLSAQRRTTSIFSGGRTTGVPCNNAARAFLNVTMQRKAGRVFRAPAKAGKLQ